MCNHLEALVYNPVYVFYKMLSELKTLLNLKKKKSNESKVLVVYLNRDLLDQISQVWVIKGNAALRSPIHNQLSQHGALLSDLFGQTTSINP